MNGKEEDIQEETTEEVWIPQKPSLEERQVRKVWLGLLQDWEAKAGWEEETKPEKKVVW